MCDEFFHMSKDYPHHIFTPSLISTIRSDIKGVEVLLIVHKAKVIVITKLFN